MWRTHSCVRHMGTLSCSLDMKLTMPLRSNSGPGKRNPAIQDAAESDSLDYGPDCTSPEAHSRSCSAILSLADSW